MKIEAGGFYAGNHDLYVREILDIFGPTVSFFEHAFRGGTVPYGFKNNVRGSFQRWIVRECTAEEIAEIIQNDFGRKTVAPMAPDASQSVGRLQIVEGRAYTNRLGRFAREITRLAGLRVTHRLFDLSDGQAQNEPTESHITSFRNWATRPCTHEESARLDRSTSAANVASFGELASQMLALATVSDDQLLAEVRRRDLPARVDGS
ncbi:hypothetical protein Sinac_7620 (plasmid) [Singulisphaera acidiphila DSM 18658]|uniref:Uncharacterized protein n=2 Tax=Singulisphaera acidiphila TaxID=466153 RepID=L0DTF1_SINAD|nr:hypothetical protein Sinac_7620 [Singulisphaera acidiphila DSM 18658]